MSQSSRSLILLLLCTFLLAAAAPVEYELRFPNAAHHEAEVEVVWRDLTTPELQVCLSRSSPGRYALHGFAKNLYGLKAYDGTGRELAAKRSKPHEWLVTGHDGTVRVVYTLYGDRADGTYNQIDESHAHLNGPATYLWARGLEDRPVRVRFHPPDGSNWEVATQLRRIDPLLYEGPDREYLLDSPAELSRFALREWKVNDGLRSQTIRMAVHHTGSPDDVDRLAEMVKAVVDEEIALFGELPVFEYGAYTFLADYLPWASGDGMEHRNSSYCTTAGSLSREPDLLIGTIAHEFFHAWNVERLRPRSLEPFDFERANLAEELWFAEGFTSYYADLIRIRAGLTNLEGFARDMGGTLNVVLNSPARRLDSPVTASLFAPYGDGAAANDPVNRINASISYYDYGAVIALGLDLALRTSFSGTTLDNYMRTMWERFGRPEQPYTMADLEQALAEVTGDGEFSRDFFRLQIYGREMPDFRVLLEHAGLVLRDSEPGRATLGEGQLEFSDDGVRVASGTTAGTPLYEAGLDRGAKLTRLDGKRIRNRKQWDRVIQDKQPGQTVEVEYEQRGKRGKVSVKVATSPKVELATFEQAGRPVTPEITAFRKVWLGSKAQPAVR